MKNSIHDVIATTLVSFLLTSCSSGVNDNATKTVAGPATPQIPIATPPSTDNAARVSNTPSSNANDARPSVMTQKLADEYFPISDEARWEYSVEMLLQPGNIIKGKTANRFDGEEIINGKQYYKMISVGSGIPGVGTQIDYYRKSVDGIYKVSGKHKTSPEYLYMPLALKVGSVWSVQEPDGEMSYRVDAVEDAELFDRKYKDCLKISFHGGMSTRAGQALVEGFIYKAQGIGDVKTTFTVRLAHAVDAGPYLTVESILER